ncbi:MAG: ABC transporter permease [Phycisphaeraceae bacterium]|nr:ABC transporter permease [Phycisphaeraceae bacterium]
MTPRIILANLMVRLRSLSRERSAMFFALAFPVLLVLVFGAIFTKPEHLNFDLPVQDLDHTAASAKFIDSLAADGLFKAIPVPADAGAVQYAKEHALTLVFIIPRGFEAAQVQRLRQGDFSASVAATYVYDPSSTSVTTKLQSLNAFVAAANQQMSGTAPFITMTAQSILEKKYRFIEFFVPGIIAMAIMTSSLSGALNMNAELRQKGILRKLATTPMTRVDWLLSNILYQLILATLSTASILLVSFAVFDVRLDINLWLPLFVVLEVFAFVGFGMVLTPIAKEAESAAGAANAFLFPMMFLSGTFFPVELMPPFLQAFARALPLFYVNQGLRASMIFADALVAAKCAAITAGVAAVVFVAGAMVTRWNREA